jgi:hypothetical protein
MGGAPAALESESTFADQLVGHFDEKEIYREKPG